jgi:hypothetical protein
MSSGFSLPRIAPSTISHSHTATVVSPHMISNPGFAMGPLRAAQLAENTLLHSQ